MPVASSKSLTHSITVGLTVATMIRTKKMSGKADVTSPTRMMMASASLPK